MKILFLSPHGYLDFSNGAATATRDLLEMLCSRGHDCRVFTTALFDYEREVPLTTLISDLKTPFYHASALLEDGTSVEVIDLTLRGVRVTLQQTASSRMSIDSPSHSEQAAFLNLAQQIYFKFIPDIMITYGGHPVNMEAMRIAKMHGIPIIFHVHNFSYLYLSAFTHASAVLVPSDYCREYYLSQLGLECHSLSLPINQERVLVDRSDPQFLTFVNPVPEKGVAVFARIASELGRRRPDIPTLVVEGRRSADCLANVGLDLSHMKNLYRMENTSDPRAFFGVTRALLVPSLWRENAALVAREAMANGIPVLASNRGGLPEALGNSGFIIEVPAKYGPYVGGIPTAEEVSQWVEVIERIWDDPEFEEHHRDLARQNAQRWIGHELAKKYENLFNSLIKKS